MVRHRWRLPLCVALIGFAVLPSTAHAAFAGQNGKIAFERDGAIWTIDPDGSQLTQITSGTPSQPDARPAWSPDGNRIAFDRRRPACSANVCHDIYVANPDGSGAALAISEGRAPTWSPTGLQIAFIHDATDTVWKANVDGSGHTPVFGPPDGDYLGLDEPAWSPDGSTIALYAEDWAEVWCDPIDGECHDVFRYRILTVSASGGTHAGHEAPGTYGLAPNWRPDGLKLAFHTSDAFSTGESIGRIGTMNPDGSDRFVPSPSGSDAQPAWSPDGTRLAFQSTNALTLMNADGTGRTGIGGIGTRPDWQPLPADTHSPFVRPAGATPFRASLVPAHQECTAPNRAHAPPLAFASCSPPVPGSPNLTVGVGDGDPAFSRSIGFVRMSVRRGMPGPPDDAEVVIRFSLSNVMRRSDLSEYTGDLRATTMVRLTDMDTPGGVRQTTQDFPLAFDVPCVPTPSSNLDKSLCATTTTLDALIPGAAPELTRAIWALDQVRVYDGGPDEDASTTGDNSLFAVQGVFIP